MHGPKGGQGGFGQEGDFGAGVVVAKGLDGGHGENGIAKPVETAEEDAGG